MLSSITSTDSSEALARNRYRVLKEQTYDALLSLKQIFHYHFVNGRARIPEVQANILRELEYQSSLELDPRTFDRLRRLPLASDIVRHARQDLVRRLDGYEVEQPERFGRVIESIEAKMMPIVVRHAMPGVANINSANYPWLVANHRKSAEAVSVSKGYVGKPEEGILNSEII